MTEEKQEDAKVRTERSASEKTERQQERTAGIAGKRWMTKGIYGSKDVPIRMLDGLIVGAFAVIIVLVIAFAVNGGYTVTFDTYGGNAISEQRLRYGTLVEEPEIPEKPGYEFAGWITSEDESLAEEWNFSEDKVEGDLTLYAEWEPAQITVKFDLDDGNFGGMKQIDDIQVTFGKSYGKLPIPSKEGFVFDGWQYSGTIISSDTMVSTSGEHILTARWVSEDDNLVLN